MFNVWLFLINLICEIFNDIIHLLISRWHQFKIFIFQLKVVLFIEKKYFYLLQTCTSVSNANSKSVRSRWCIGDHLNSGIRNIVVRGPGLNWRRCSSVIGIPRNPKSTRRSLSCCVIDRPWTAWRQKRGTFVEWKRNIWFQNENSKYS